MPKIAPRFTQKPALGQEGADIVFNCEVEAAPRPSITWFRGDTEISNTERVVLTESQLPGTNKYQLKLLIKNVAIGDSAVYRVEGRNKLGNMSANINLNLSGENLIIELVLYRYIETFDIPGLVKTQTPYRHINRTLNIYKLISFSSGSANAIGQDNRPYIETYTDPMISVLGRYMHLPA